MTCYIAEKTTGSNVHLTVPDTITGGQNYVMQFGRHYAFGVGGGTVVTATRVVSQTYANATMDALVSNVGAGGPTYLVVTVGAQEVYSQAVVITQATTIPIANFAGALNQYISTHPGGSTIDVPFQVTIDRQADVILTNLVLTAAASVDVSVTTGDIAFGASSPTEGATVPVTATLHNLGSTDSGPLAASFFATLTLGVTTTLPFYIGSAFVPNVPAGGTAAANIAWNTLGFTGSVPMRVVADPFNRLAETNESNNSAQVTFNVLSRPDLLVSRLVPSDPEPTVGEGIAVAVAARNAGQTGAGTFTLSLYDGNPSAGGTLIGARALSIGAGAEVTSTISWTPTSRGQHQLFAVADSGSVVNEYDKSNNQTIQPIFVGFAGPILVDSGGASDPPYTSTVGYGYLTSGTSTSNLCGNEAYQTVRQSISTTLQYRFDNLLPGHFYHVDVTLFECDGSGRRERVLMDGLQIAAPVDLSDAQVHRLSLRLDPATYADNTIIATIEETQGLNAIVSEVRLYDVDYRYADAGGLNEQPYSPALGYGYLDGSRNAPYGELPVLTQRRNVSGSAVRYEYDHLDPLRRYAVAMTFYHRFVTTQTQQIGIDAAYGGPTFTVPYSQVLPLTVPVPVSAYATDGSIVVYITKTNALIGGFVNEIALEEVTLPDSLTSADVAPLATATPSPAILGQPLTYTVFITNYGPDTATNVRMTGTLPISATFGSSGATQGSCSGTSVVLCAPGDIPLGASVRVTVVVTPTAMGSLQAGFAVTSDAADPFPLNNQVTVIVSVIGSNRTYLPILIR